VGLGLGGGGARGAAHVGVLKKLEELRIPVHCVAGTSMGGLVAGAFSARLSADEMQTALAQADWRDMFNDSASFADIPSRQQSLLRTYIPGTESGLKNGSLQFPSAALGGQKIKFFIDRLIGANIAPQTIQGQSIPLALITTDIVTGQRRAYREGSLATVMRATMSVPGLMAPVSYQGQTLVDGGLVDNVPIREVHDLCSPDVIIAVNVGSPLLKREDIEASPLSVAVQMVNILTEQNVAQSLTLLKPNIDIYLTPDLDGISAGDFEKNAETVKRGYQAALAAEVRLKALSVSPEMYAAWQQKTARSAAPANPIDGIEVVNLSPEKALQFAKRISQKTGETLQTKTLEEDLLYLHGDGRHSNLEYQLLNDRDKNILRLVPTEKAWGPNFLRAGVNFSWEKEGDAKYNLRLAYQLTELNAKGGEILFSGQVGSENRLGVNFYQPLESTQRWFVEVADIYSNQDINLYQNNKVQAQYDSSFNELSGALGYNINRYGSLRMGASHTNQSTELRIGPSNALPGAGSTSTDAVFLQLRLDRMNRLYFPTSGWNAQIKFSDTAEYSRLDGQTSAATSLGQYVFTGKLAYTGSPQGALPLNNAAFLGGPNNLGGLATRQLIGDNMRYASGRIEKIVSQMPLGIRGDLRVGVALEGANMGTRYSEVQSQDTVKSGSLYVGGETALGPIYLGVSKAVSYSPRVFMFIGTP
jgi:NTE family protein